MFCVVIELLHAETRMFRVEIELLRRNATLFRGKTDMFRGKTNMYMFRGIVTLPRLNTCLLCLAQVSCLKMKPFYMKLHDTSKLFQV